MIATIYLQWTSDPVLGESYEPDNESGGRSDGDSGDGRRSPPSTRSKRSVNIANFGSENGVRTIAFRGGYSEGQKDGLELPGLTTDSSSDELSGNVIRPSCYAPSVHSAQIKEDIKESP